MEKYEQLEFEITKKLGHSDNLEQRCFDNNGDEIKIGDSVVAVRGEAKLNCVEGIVKNIIHDEGYGMYITVVSYGGKILERNGRPFLYEVVKNTF